MNYWSYWFWIVASGQKLQFARGSVSSHYEVGDFAYVH
jgi:hypothetical protein